MGEELAYRGLHMNPTNGKGSKRRPENKAAFDESFDKIFTRKKTPAHGATKTHKDKTKYNRKRIDTND